MTTCSSTSGNATSNLVGALAHQCERLELVCHHLKQAAQVLIDEPEKQQPKHLAGSMFLTDCYAALNPGPHTESMFYVSGPQTDGVRHLSRICPFAYDSRSAAYVSGDITSSLGALVLMERFGHRLHGWFHSHPGTGPGATTPSSTDMGHQQLLENGNHLAIGAIFTQDGYVRFFSRELALNIEVYGQGVEKTDDSLYRLTELQALDHPANLDEPPHGGRCDRPSAERSWLRSDCPAEGTCGPNRGRGVREPGGLGALAEGRGDPEDL